MKKIPCPYLHGEVELSDDREAHIAENHPELLPEHYEFIAKTLEAPDEVRRSRRFGNARLFSRWFEGFMGGKNTVVVVVTEAVSADRRHWVITAYVSKKLAEGEVEWIKS